MTHDEFATWDAAYVLGALSPADRRAFEEHLRDCERCGAAVGELAGMPGLLGSVPRERALSLLGPSNDAVADAEGDGIQALSGDAVVPGVSASADAYRADTSPDNTPTDILPALLHRARRRRARSRWLTAGIAAAAAAVVAVVLAIAFPGALHTDSGSSARAVAMEQVEPSALTADLWLTAKPWGTRIDSRCTYAHVGGESGSHSWAYAMVVTDRSGRQTQISTWTADEGSTVVPVATTSVPLAEIAAVDIRSARDGTVLLRSTFG